MFFYTLLFVVSVISALVILYLYNALLRIGKSVYKARLPGSKESPTGHLQGARFSSSVNNTRTPWGWKNHATPSNTARTHPAAPNRQAPWGWRGSEHEVRNQGAASANATGFDAFLNSNVGASGSQVTQKPTVGWPYREEKSEAAGRVYKVTRKAVHPRTNLKNTAKPWGW